MIIPRLLVFWLIVILLVSIASRKAQERVDAIRLYKREVSYKELQQEYVGVFWQLAWQFTLVRFAIYLPLFLLIRLFGNSFTGLMAVSFIPELTVLDLYQGPVPTPIPTPTLIGLLCLTAVILSYLLSAVASVIAFLRMLNQRKLAG